MLSFEDKVKSLRRRLLELESAVVAFSGGVDSSVLVAVAHEELRSQMIAAMSVSASLPLNDRLVAESFCEERGIPLRFIETKEFYDPLYACNPSDRCYHCKRHLYSSLTFLADELRFSFVVEGTNASDLSGHRPGNRASRENPRVATPLIDAGFTKEDVRRLARQMNLVTAGKPSAACLSSRVPTGALLSPELMRRIDAAEDSLRSFGALQVRVRHHGELARIEVTPSDFNLCFERRNEISERLQGLGWKFVTLDLLGYRQGGMRE